MERRLNNNNLNNGMIDTERELVMLDQSRTDIGSARDKLRSTVLAGVPTVLFNYPNSSDGMGR